MRTDLSIAPLNVCFLKNLPNAIEPKRATPGSAAYDLYAAQIQLDAANNRLIIDTGLSTSFPPDFVMLVFGRSGLAMKHGIRLANSVAVIDSDYRGPIKILLRSDHLSGDELMNVIRVGERVAQAVFMPCAAANLIQVWAVDELEASDRGVGGFGSTGN